MNYLKYIFQKLFEWLAFVFGEKVDPVETSEGESDELNEIETVETSEESNDTQENNLEEENNNMPEHEIIVLLDNGHAKSTPGKRSPKEEGMEQFFEYEFNRDIVKRIAVKLSKLGVKYEILVPEVEKDIALSERAARANKFCNEYGKKNCLFLSIHANAAGNGTTWANARGWCCYTSRGETVSDDYAELFMKKAEEEFAEYGQKIRKYSQKKYSWEENYTVLVKTNCAAILTENFFYDNKKDLEFLQTEEGREAIAKLHVDAILEIEKLMKQ